MTSSPAELERELFGLLVDARTTNEMAVAAFTVVALEHIANFPAEINLVWKSRWSISSALYIWIRYLTLLALCVDLSFMLRAEWSDHLPVVPFGELVTSTILVISADIVLVLRVWILYGRSRKLLYFLIPFMAAEMISIMIVGVFTIAALTADPENYVHVGPILGGCYSLEVPRLFTFYAIPPFVTAVIMFSMTAFKCGTTLMALGPRRTPIIALFLRDGVFWFLALVLVSIVEIVLWDRARPTLAQIPVIPSSAYVLPDLPQLRSLNIKIKLQMCCDDRRTRIKAVASHTGEAAGATTVGTELVVRRPGTTRELEAYNMDTINPLGIDSDNAASNADLAVTTVDSEFVVRCPGT
ncbi:hypothetical protein DFH06DRAFT_1339462 [Mycena polygramma]|nr:hypothetical protein DFH06DRAFT_1339462 [Mycena polygramma]